MDNLDDIKAPAKRPGWTFTIPGSLLKIDAKRWTAEQRANGVKIRCLFPTPLDEQRSVSEALSEGSPGAVMYFQVRNSVSELDDKIIDYVERPMVWDDIGGGGRTLAVDLFQRAPTPDKEALTKGRDSFSLSI